MGLLGVKFRGLCVCVTTCRYRFLFLARWVRFKQTWKVFFLSFFLFKIYSVEAVSSLLHDCISIVDCGPASHPVLIPGIDNIPRSDGNSRFVLLSVQGTLTIFMSG